MDWDFTKALMRFVDFLQYGLLGSFGAAANYVYVTVTQGKKFVWLIFAANIFVSFFVGNLAGEFIDAGNRYKDGLIMACGYCAFPVLAIVETKVRDWLTRFNPV